MQNKKLKVRLSRDVIPMRYDIKLHPDLENFTFIGTEIITLNLLKDIKEITLHSKDIDIETARVDKDYTNKITYNQKAEIVTFVFNKKIPKGKHTLTISFKGILNDKMRGFYKSSYIYEGKVHNIATTQFEATDARRAFPCFDEPAQKAVFNVSLVIPKGKTAISNTLPISKVEHEAGFEVVKFAPSPKMSTYLLAFIVGDFEYIEKKSKRGVIVRVYTPKGKKHQAKFSLDVTVKVLDFYEEYFAIPYPLNTLDMIAIPDFSSLAMENWGAITFREIGLLVDEGNTSIASKERITEVIAHELAHQWFGNLVTMEWWTHLWLNEGFATYIPYVVIDKLFPHWEIWKRFVSDDLSLSLKLDSLQNTHPIEIEVHHPDEIGEIFDTISYLKGASVIRMLANYLGEKDFRDGLRYYLKKHSYRNTETGHLWQAFEKISKKPVRKMMQNWTAKSGFPLVSVDIKGDKLKLSQERFFSSVISKSKTKDNTVWQIPISIKTNHQTINTFLSTKNNYVSHPNKEWLKLNENESSFFQTNYNKDLLKKLENPIINKILSPADRLGLIRDLFALAEAGYIETTSVFEFLKNYQNEDEYIVWVEISGGLSKIENLITNPSTKLNLNKFTINLYRGIFKKLGWDKKIGEKHTDTLLRSIVISKLGRSGDEKIIKEARRKFMAMQKGIQIDPDLRSVIYRIIATFGNNKDYDVFIKKYKTETLHEERNRIGYTLGEFQDDQILCKVLEFALSSDVRAQDTTGILNYIAMNPKGRNIWFKFIKYRWDIILSRYGDGGHTIAGILKAIAGTSEKKHLDLFKQFIKTHKTPGAERAVEQVLERIENNVLWRERDGKLISKFLKNIT